ncbi:MAG: DUF1833 family protein [Limnohabitans sp.]
MPIVFVGSASGVTSAVLPAHQAGDVLLAFAYRDGNNNATGVPAGWTTISNTGGANSNSASMAYRLAASDAETSGTWSNATSLIVQIYRGVASIGADAFATGSSTTVTYPGLVLEVANGTSWVAAFTGHRSVNTALEVAPPGLILRENTLDATDEASGFDTGIGVSDWTVRSVAVGGTASGWFARTVELRAQEDAQGSSLTSVLVQAQGDGAALDVLASGSAAQVSVLALGGGMASSEEAFGGGAANVTVVVQATGLAQEIASGSSEVGVTVLASGHGADTSEHQQGGASAQALVQAAGVGDAFFVYLSGGSSTGVWVDAIAQSLAQDVVSGSGQAAVQVNTWGLGQAQDQVSGASQATVQVSPVGGGRFRIRVLRAGLTDAIREAYASAPSDSVIYHTLEIWHPAFSEPIRVVRDRNTLTAKLESTAPRQAGQAVTFVGFAFDIVPPEVTHTAVPQCVIELDNVSREIVAHFEQAITTPDLITVTYRAYLSDDLTAPENDPPLTLTVLSISANVFRVRATCGFANLANKRFPGLDYTAEVFPGLISQ